MVKFPPTIVQDLKLMIPLSVIINYVTVKYISKKARIFIPLEEYNLW